MDKARGDARSKGGPLLSLTMDDALLAVTCIIGSFHRAGR